MPITAARRASNTLRLESLESRRLLAAFGTPWPDARSLSLSFPADGVQVAGQSNDLTATLDQVASRENWQEIVLRAVQTWAYHADINVGLQADSDLDFGTPGLSVADPRFGDLRIGAVPQQGVLASALPFQVVAGTFSGDILLNSDVSFSYHDWLGDEPPEPEASAPVNYDLLSVLLNEVGNSLGLEDSLESSSVMFLQYTEPKGLLTAEDVAAIQSLYGARSDPYELVDNGELSTATLIPVPVGFQPAQATIDVRGSLQSASDVDVFQLPVNISQKLIRFDLTAAGISLLQSRVELLDGSGQVVRTAAAESVFDNDLTIDLRDFSGSGPFYVRVSAKDDSVYSVGDYQLSLTYGPAILGGVDDGDGLIQRVYSNFWNQYYGVIDRVADRLVDAEFGLNETISAATALPVALGHAAGNRFEVLSSVAGSVAGETTDVDVWKLTSPDEIQGPLTVHLASVEPQATSLRVQILDSSGQTVGASGVLRDDGTWTLELKEPTPSTEYFIRVSVDPSSEVQVGDYVASAEFAVDHVQLHQMVSRTISSSVDDFVRWTASRSKLYRFDLKAGAAAPGDWVQLTIYDAHTREIRMSLGTPEAGIRTAYAMLPEGEYILRFSAHSRSGNTVPAIDLELRTDGLSDDLDPDDPIGDPDYGPGYVPYTYYEQYVDYTEYYPETYEDPSYGYDYYSSYSYYSSSP